MTLPTARRLLEGAAMSKRLLAFNVVLGGLAVLFALHIVRTLWPPPLPAPTGALVRARALARDSSPPPPRPFVAYDVVVSRNLFSPDRTETVPSPVPVAAPAPPVVKPVLHGVVINGTTQRAYLEDPATKHVFGYTIGDAIAGGVVERIEAERVVIRRPEGTLVVALTDPIKQKTARPAPPDGSSPPPPSSPRRRNPAAGSDAPVPAR